MAAKFQAKIPEATLNSGHQMPVVGFGLGASSVLPLDELVPIIIHAMEIGCRHFDTAAVYGTEEALGKAVAKALATGLIKTRDELFITSKLWITDGRPDLVLPALKKSLATMELEYLDLYLIHFPVRAEKDGDKLAFLPLDIQGTWEAMEGCSKLGLTKSIGLSNFTCEKISKLLENASIPPAINQVEMNVGWQQRKLLPFCKEKGIQVCAWSPLGGSGSPWGSNAVMENETLKAIATSKCKTIAQVALRWLYEQGVGIIVRSFNKERIKQNLEIFDWELTDEERARILLIPQRRVATAEFVLPGGLSVEEFWDGDV